MARRNKSKCERTRPIGSNPRRYFGFPSEINVRSFIKRENPDLGNCIGKIRRLKKRDDIISKSGNDYLVHFKIRKK